VRRIRTGAPAHPQWPSIVRRIVELAHDHGARALAQGYLFGKPQGIRKFARSRPQLASSSSKKI
jgi:EAL domain-containing protein (putative c-di-GMP-specific phosphodiesterase class I)